MKPLLSVRNLGVSFATASGQVDAVRGASFDVMAGEILGIVGESGSGKSVTCRALTGLLPQSASITGSVRFENRELLELDEAGLQRLRGRKISMVFQNPASHLDPLMTIGRQICEPLIQHEGLDFASAREMAERGLAEVRIDEADRRFDSYPHQLSGGMKQRAMIASAIACRPALLLADEPTTALDATVQSHILELLQELNRAKGLSIVLVSHDLGVIAKSCDRVLVMKDGEIIEQGATREITGSPQKAYTRELIESQPGRRRDSESSPGRDNGQTLLDIDSLYVEFRLPGRRRKVFKAVDGVSLSLRGGEALGIVGESGSGKSTLARVVVGLVRPAAGEVRINAPVQMVFQNPFDSLNPRLSIGKTIAEPLFRHRLVERGQVQARVRELMTLVELEPQLADRKPRQLSGGQCQRVGIARALAMKPEILIADEITSALDVTIQAQIMKLLGRLRRQTGLSVIFISHDLALVNDFCDRVAVLRAGTIVETGLVRQVLRHPAHDYTRQLIESAHQDLITG